MQNKIFNKNPLFDIAFLQELFSSKHREVFARITLLSNDEQPIETIEGKITDGSINVDGASAVRRTCSLTLVTQDVTIYNIYWGLSNKFKLEVGLKNNINSFYPEIIWFKQGIFVFTQFNTSNATNGTNIKIQGKDKMCLLNGDLAGQLPSVDFSREQYLDVATGEITFTDLSIKTIIRKLLQEFALELPHNIIINDIDEMGLELLEYRGTEPLYLLRNQFGEYVQFTINGELACHYKLKSIIDQETYNNIPAKYEELKGFYSKNHENELYYLIADYDDFWVNGTLNDGFMISYLPLLKDIDEDNFTNIKLSLEEDTVYKVSQINYGDAAGYRAVDLIFGGELKSNIGETITSILDKIKNKFTNFEYYYDVDGRFVFQKKKEYLITAWNEEGQLQTKAGIDGTEILYNFKNNASISSISNNPKIQNLKNDYSVHGNRDNLALHMRYAIDEKPKLYQPIRTLKEKIITVIQKPNNQFDFSEEIKYYDIPEINFHENEDGLIGVDTSILILDILRDQEKVYTLNELDDLKNKIIKNTTIDKNFYESWFNLFSINNNDEYVWQGSTEDVKNMIAEIARCESINDIHPSFNVIEKDEEETWFLLCPYFASYPYSVDYVALDNSTNEIKFFNESPPTDKYTLIHNKVDWRELIYQMALDYRKLNMTDNYYYYLKQRNPHLKYYKTGYEQYYADISLWRDLYNPNPVLLFNGPLKANVVKGILNPGKFDELNSIYINNNYRLITADDIENLTYDKVFKYQSLSEDNLRYAIYPFIHSDSCALNNSGTYFIEDQATGAMVQKGPVNEDTEKIKELNSISITDFYIKENNEYKLFVQQQFDNEKENMVNNNNYYICADKYLPLTETDGIIWNLYYRSIFYSLFYESRLCLDNLNAIIDDFESYENNAVVYLNKIIEILKAYIIYLNNGLDAREVKIAFLTLLENSIQEYLSDDINNLINDLIELNADNTCLYAIAEYLKNRIEKDFYIEGELYLNTAAVTDRTVDEQLLIYLSFIKTFNSLIQNTIDTINKNYLQVQFIEQENTNFTTLLDLTEGQSTKEDRIQEIKKLLDSIKNTLSSIKSQYQDGQAQKTLNSVEALLNSIDSIDDIDAIWDILIVRIPLIVEQVTLLDNTIKNINKIIQQQFIWTPDNKKPQKDEENYIVLLENWESKKINKRDTNEFFILLNKIKNLLMLTKPVDTNCSLGDNKNYYSNILIFNNESLIESLHSQVCDATNNELLNTILEEFNQTHKDFQDCLIQEDINNFNEINSNKIIKTSIDYYQPMYNYEHDDKAGKYWLKNLNNDVQNLTFWFDFLEPSSLELSKCSVPAIGSRMMAMNDQDVKTIHHKTVPEFILHSQQYQHDNTFSGYQYINLTDGFMNLFAISSRGKSAKEKIEELLYNYSHCAETVNVSLVPMYNLEPGCKVYLQDDVNGINGEYIISKLTIPLTYNKMMSFTATKTISSIT